VSTQLSPQIRVFAIVGVLLVALAGGGLFYLQHRSQPETVTVPSTPRATTPASTVSTTATSTVSGNTSTTATTPNTAHHATAPAVHPVRVDPNLPAPLRSALRQHRIVVAGLYDPQVRVDRIALGEAAIGAAEARVGFVRVNVLDNKVAGPLTALLPAGNTLPDPGILVYRRPGKLVFRFDGYLDHAAILQVLQAAR
jgi:hypothetical protein